MTAEVRVPTREEALSNAARLLEWAANETDLAKMERLDELAGSWLTYVAVVDGGERT